MKESILQFIKNYILQHGYPPTVREIGAAVGLKSTSSVQSHLKKMLDLGMIETEAGIGSPRAIRVPGMKFLNESGESGWICVDEEMPGCHCQKLIEEGNNEKL